MSISQYVYTKIVYRFFCHSFSTIGYFETRGKIGSGLCPEGLFEGGILSQCSVQPHSIQQKKPQCPWQSHCANGHFRVPKFSLSKRGYVRNFSCVVSYISMRIEAPFHISGSYLGSPWKKGLGSWEMTHSIPTHSKRANTQESWPLQRM